MFMVVTSSFSCRPRGSQSPALLDIGTTSRLRAYWLTDAGEINFLGCEPIGVQCQDIFLSRRYFGCRPIVAKGISSRILEKKFSSEVM